MFQTPREFEDEVRRIARLLWPAAEYGGATMVGGRERDGIFETDEVIYLVECTMRRDKQKAEEDGEKLAKLKTQLARKHPAKVVKGFFVTLHEPTADQKTAIADQRSGLVALSFDQFRSKLVDARSYLQARQNYPFGSVADPDTGKARGKASYDLKYVPLEFTIAGSGSMTIDGLVNGLSEQKKRLAPNGFLAGGC